MLKEFTRVSEDGIIEKIIKKTEQAERILTTRRSWNLETTVIKYEMMNEAAQACFY